MVMQSTYTQSAVHVAAAASRFIVSTQGGGMGGGTAPPGGIYKIIYFITPWAKGPYLIWAFGPLPYGAEGPIYYCIWGAMPPMPPDHDVDELRT